MDCISGDGKVKVRISASYTGGWGEGGKLSDSKLSLQDNEGFLIDIATGTLTLTLTSTAPAKSFLRHLSAANWKDVQHIVGKLKPPSIDPRLLQLPKWTTKTWHHLAEAPVTIFSDATPYAAAEYYPAGNTLVVKRLTNLQEINRVEIVARLMEVCWHNRELNPSRIRLGVDNTTTLQCVSTGRGLIFNYYNSSGCFTFGRWMPYVTSTLMCSGSSQSSTLPTMPPGPRH
uniref:Uncharacterized protein n=1 Tax=Timema bartmani TaxID=61472 RepID=A0A7R9EQU2_9NEOP|nr:unnamed protein product [Timema bartmani]